jgi:Leu/Phe-tRNA-protein transferase
VKTIDVEIMDTDVKTNILKEFGVHNTKKKIVGNIYELKLPLEDKVYPEMWYNHQPRSVVMDQTLAKIKV